MTHKQRQDTRSRILAAAEELSCEVGPAKVSIEAVALRAGISKGGLLYHFPTKHDLLRAIVAGHVEGIRAALAAQAAGSADPLDLARAYLRVMQEKLAGSSAPPGLFAAIAEDPEFIAPLRAFRQAVLADVFLRCPDPQLGAVVYYACEGMVHAQLTDSHAEASGERVAVFHALDLLLAQEPPCCG